jgi:hypothetical protein
MPVYPVLTAPRQDPAKWDPSNVSLQTASRNLPLPLAIAEPESTSASVRGLSGTAPHPVAANNISNSLRVVIT